MPHKDIRGDHPADGTVFRARGLTKVYDMGEVKVHALRGVDLDLFPGELIVLLGPSVLQSFTARFALSETQ